MQFTCILKHANCASSNGGECRSIELFALHSPVPEVTRHYMKTLQKLRIKQKEESAQ